MPVNPIQDQHKTGNLFQAYLQIVSTFFRTTQDVRDVRDVFDVSLVRDVRDVFANARCPEKNKTSRNAECRCGGPRVSKGLSSKATFPVWNLEFKQPAEAGTQNAMAFQAFHEFQVFHFFHSFQPFQECMASTKNETACPKRKKRARPGRRRFFIENYGAEISYVYFAWRGPSGLRASIFRSPCPRPRRSACCGSASPSRGRPRGRIGLGSSRPARG